MRWPYVAGLVVALGAACTVPPSAKGPEATSPAAGRPDSGSGIELVDYQVRPGDAAVERYGGPVMHRLSAVEKTIQKELGQVKARHEAALSRMARELARTAPDRFNIPPALVDGLMAWSGMVDPPPRLTIVELGPDAPDCANKVVPACRESIASLVEQVRATMPEGPEVIFGIGAGTAPSGAPRFIVAALDRAVRIDPVPAAVSSGTEMEVSGRLVGERTRPSVEVVDPNGHWTSVPTLAGDDHSFKARVRCTSDGPHQIEVLAEGQHGPEVTANFPVYCGSEAPREIHAEVEHVGNGVTPEQIARANFDYLNAERQQRGLPPLQWDRKASKVALAHSRDMETNGFVGHRSPTTGDVSDRFAAAKLGGTIIRENVARGYGPKQIHQSLMRSPGHRVNILAEDVTHVGIGVVIGPREANVEDVPRPLFATQNFFRDPRAAAAQEGDPVKALRGRVDEQRKAAGLPPVRWNKALGRVAADQAKAVARGKKPDLGKTLEKQLASEGFASIDRHHVESNDVAGFTSLDLWKESDPGVIGIGVAERRSKDGTAYVLMVFVAR